MTPVACVGVIFITLFSFAVCCHDFEIVQLLHIRRFNMTKDAPELIDRRTILKAGMTAAFGTGLSAKNQSPDSTQSHAYLWYQKPAANWNEALPIGNGRLGAMMFGGVAQERIQLNEDTLWAGGPYCPDNPEAHAALPEVRRLIAEGHFKEAADLAGAKMMAKPLWQMAYGSLGDLLITFENAEAPVEYQRSLDLEKALHTVAYKTANGAFTRQAFSSADDQVIVVHLEGQAATSNFTVAWRTPRKTHYTPPNYQGAATVLTENQAPAWLTVEPPWNNRTDVNLSSDGEAALLLSGNNEAGPDVQNGLRYAMRLKVICDGNVAINDGQIKVSNATSATLLIAAATSFVRFDDVSGDPIAKVRERTETAARKPYDTLLDNHIKAHQALYSGVSLDLGHSTTEALPTDERIALDALDKDPALVALYFAFARYLLISSSRPGTQPANLQGLWNEGINPPWGSKYTININTQMNYWPADSMGLGACVEPLIKMVEELSNTGQKTAKTMYGARGWVAHHNTDLWRATAPIDGPYWGLWPCGGAWLCNTLWDHFDHNRDLNLLARLYPLLKGASLFFLDTLIEDPQGRGLITSPSISPENAHPFGTSVCAGPAMDRQIVRDLFQNTFDAGTLLQKDHALLTQVAAASKALARDRVGKQGQLQEWLEDWDADAPEQQHRHVSHLYSVYPSSQINLRDTPELISAAKVSLNKRGDMATGWGTAWRLCLWARMAEPERAFGLLKGLIGPMRTYPNMLDAHPPFQIDGNFGGAAGIVEMLVQSWGQEVRLLPALPDAWPYGSLKGVRLRGALRIDLIWENGRMKNATFSGKPQQPVRIVYRGKIFVRKLNGSGVLNFKAGL